MVGMIRDDRRKALQYKRNQSVYDRRFCSKMEDISNFGFVAYSEVIIESYEKPSFAPEGTKCGFISR